MTANLLGVLLRLASVVVHPAASKCSNVLGPRIFCSREALHILFEFSVTRQAAWDRRLHSRRNPPLLCGNSSAAFSLDIRGRDRNEAVTIGQSREQ